MNSRITWWLVTVALAFFGYICFFERAPQPPGADQTQPKPLFTDFDVAQATVVEIIRSNRVIHAERVGEQWRLTTPAYPAQSVGLEALLESVARLTDQGFISPRELNAQPGGLAAFGLVDPPFASVMLQSEAGRLRFNVGRPTPLGDQVYVQIIGSAGLFITPGTFLLHLPRTADDWRDPTLLGLNRQSFDRLAVQSGARFFEIEREATNQIWRLIKPMPARADTSRVELLLQQLRAARVTRFVTDDPRADLEAFGLQTPEVDLALARGTNRLAHIQFGKSPTNDPTQIFARRLSHTNIVLVPREFADLLRQPFTAFRDRSLLTFSPAAVDRLEAKGDEAFTLQRQPGGAWTILEPTPLPADPVLVGEFLTNLAQLEIVKFDKDVVTDFSVYGLAPPRRQFSLRTAVTNGPAVTSQLLAPLEFGTTNTVDTVFARRSDETSVYAVSAGEIERLPRAAFELRDRRVWNFASSNVTAIAITQKGQTRKLARDPARGWSPDAIANAALEETLHRLGQLQAVAWAARGEDKLKRFGIGDVAWKIALDVALDGRLQTLILEFGRLSPRGNPYATATLAGETQPVIFQFPARLFPDVVRDLGATAAP